MKEISIDTRCHSYLAFSLFRSNHFQNNFTLLLFSLDSHWNTTPLLVIWLQKNIKRCFSKQNQSHLDIYFPVDTGRKLNVHKTVSFHSSKQLLTIYFFRNSVSTGSSCFSATSFCFNYFFSCICSYLLFHVPKLSKLLFYITQITASQASIIRRRSRSSRSSHQASAVCWSLQLY